MSNVIKSTHINVSATNKYNVEIVPIVNEIISNQVMKNEDDLPFNIINEKEILELAKQKADEIISKAIEKANKLSTQMLSDVQIESHQIKMSAQKTGYDTGYGKALEEVELLKNQVQLQLEDTLKQKEEVLLGIEPQMVEMVLNISKTIFEKALDINPQIIVLLVKKGLSQASTNGKIFIHICKEHYDVMVENSSQIMDYIGNSDVEIIKDLSLSKGDCIIETPFGTIDSSFDQQFEAIKKDLTYISENR